MIKKITFEELVDTAAEKSDSSKAFTRDFIREMANVIQMGLVRDGVVNISGFGIFRLQDVDSRKGRNPQTGEEITIPSHKKVLFKPEKSLREIINKRYEHLEPQIIDDGPGRVEKKEKPVEPENVGAAFFNEAMDADLKKSTEKPITPAEPQKEEEKEPVIAPHAAPQNRPQEAKQKKSKTIPIAAALIVVLILILFVYNYDSEDAGQESELAESAPVEHIEQPEAPVQNQDGEKPVESSSVEETAAPVQQKPERAQPEEVEHAINEGENLWQLAQRYYDDGYKWPLILLENRDRLSDPDFVPEGVVLNIPVVEKNGGDNDSELKSRLAQGHLLAYNAYKNKDNASALNHLYVAYRYDETQVNASMATVDEQDYQTIINYPGVVR